MRQRTLQREFRFGGKGLHTGKIAHMTVGPAPENTGVRFLRTDLGEGAYVDALAANVSRTARSTMISDGEVSVRTVEHLLAALTGLGIDNALVRLDGQEAPILDGSAAPYVEAFTADSIVEQETERQWMELREPVVVEDPRTGAYLRITPADQPSYEVTIDFNSRVLGVQTVHWDPSVDFATQIGPCRTFCFFHELKRLVLLGMIKGGDLENAIVVVENKVPLWQIRLWLRLFGLPLPEGMSREPGCYARGGLRFPDECGRHKLLDVLGDLRLCGGFLKAKVEAYKPGHRMNTLAAKEISKVLYNG